MFTVSFLIKSTSISGLSINDDDDWLSINDDDDYLDKVLRVFCESYSEFANTAHKSIVFGVVYSSIQKFTIIFILIMNKYLDIAIYLSR